MLFDFWFDVPQHPTHDADLLGFMPAEVSELIVVFQELCKIEGGDGIVFRPETVRAIDIRKEANYPGIRVTTRAEKTGQLAQASGLSSRKEPPAIPGRGWKNRACTA
ncbi:hypothetical protein CEY11_23450 [Candidimonas nitroreducens]|uniref:Uncharacterized protein n=1 Tax=Candidimonas nitroreducens TaxID=683354 RepID=A0A225M182_9BURK|nr:hypothetical protein [Candidimonas nitroreducens]OWT53950.1 hypothetical protein CEY11_23450 [Candidimonas nitroreducens]